MTSLCNSWLRWAEDAVNLNLEAQAVITMRVAALAGGGPAAGEEGLLMIVEKGEAVCDAAWLVASSMLAGEAHLAPERALDLIRSRVRANHRRLAGTLERDS